MARVTTEVSAPSDAVWRVLSDGWSYATWVVGTVKIRDVDSGFPAVGTKLHHAVGAWPLLLEDETEILECEAGRRLVMQARGWPVEVRGADLRPRRLGQQPPCRRARRQAAS